jgi:aryl-phospho-beta-D-glucosidase BglC (GH1 family)
MRRLIIIFFLLALPLLSQTNDLAFRRAAHLRHGINTSEWFAQNPGRYTPERLATYTGVDDIALIKQLGFDHIRLSVDPDPLMGPLVWSPETASHDPFVTALDKIVHAAQDQGLAVIIDIHPESDFKRRVREDGNFAGRFADLWRALAMHYAKLSPDLTFFEVMNEPEDQDANQWLGMQAQLAAAIRIVAPQNTIIISGSRWSDIDQLLLLQPLADPDLIYNFHFYTPHPFTHQGASWSSNIESHLRKVHYPSRPDDSSALRDQLPTPIEQYEITKYAFDTWNSSRIASEIDIAAQWARDRHVPLTCNEFGVYRRYSDPVERAVWINDVRTSFERNNIGWTMWDYRGGFGVVTKENGKPAVPDHAILKALGLEK